MKLRERLGPSAAEIEARISAQPAPQPVDAPIRPASTLLVEVIYAKLRGTR